MSLDNDRGQGSKYPDEILDPQVGSGVAGVIVGGAFGALLLSLVLLPAVLSNAPQGMELSVALGVCLTEVTVVTVLCTHLLLQYNGQGRRSSAGDKPITRRLIEVNIPYAAAFELCLAATAELTNYQLQQVDDQTGVIRLQARRPRFSCAVPTVLFSVKAVSPSETLIEISCAIVSSANMRSCRPLSCQPGHCPFPCTDRADEKLIERLERFIRRLPDWDYCHGTAPRQ